MKKRIWFISIVLLCTTLGIFAQGQTEQPSVVRTVTWWHSNSGLLQTAADSMVEEFNATIGKEKGIVVRSVYQGKSNDVLTKTKALLQEDGNTDLPDLVQLDASAVLDIRDSKYLISMEKLAKDDSFDLNQILEACKLSVTYKGEMIGMPFNSSTIMLYYNKTAFEEAGIKEPPKDLDELASVAAKLVQKDAKGKTIRYGVANVPTTYELCVWLGQQNGMSLITDQENGHTGLPTKVLFDENGTMSTFLKKWKALYATGALENLTSDVNSEFSSGKVAMMAASTSKLTTVLQMVGNRFELGVANLPRVNDQATGGVNVGGGALYAFDNGSGNSQATWEFVKFATSSKQQLAWHIATGYFPVNKQTYKDQDFITYNNEHPLFAVAIKQLQESNPLVQGIWVPSAYQIYYAFQSGILKMLVEDQGVEETTQALAKEINGYLTDYAQANPQ
ncbi:ABC transporter substrate-binding protein [uncultured Sphaerochaeta sp.]|uniref:ABC transporter substrate-binding protein n=1 Tax=uncultured Sphaerochaeta sp. TaxID=886478 RepID=UPI002A0A7680|nr:ABC transporter substrate-binding protein [uncultured Sphaerochaeta sp.]